MTFEDLLMGDLSMVKAGGQNGSDHVQHAYDEILAAHEADKQAAVAEAVKTEYEELAGWPMKDLPYHVDYKLRELKSEHERGGSDET